MPQPTAAETIAKYTPVPPKQVRDGVANIDALILAQKNPPPTLPAPGDQPPAPPVPPGAPTPPAQPEPPAAPPVPPPAAPPAPPAGSDLEQQHRSLQGRYDNQARVIQEQAARMGELERMVASMRSTAPTPPAEPAAPVRLLTDEELSEYGAEMIDVVGKRAKEVFTPELSAFDLRMKALENRLEGVTTVTAATARERLYTDLTSAVANWRQINMSPEFKDWLAFADPYSGQRRMDMLQSAFAGHETNRVIQFFKGFLEATGTPPSPPSLAPTPDPGQAPPAAPTLEDLAAPGRARSAPTPPGAPEKPTYTSAWYAQFKRDQLMGKWKGREADAEAIERDVFAAQHEGRFIP